MIPKNVITVKYTSGNEFINTKSNTFYTGSYYEFNNKTYVGSKFTGRDDEIIKIQESNTLLNNPQTVIFSLTSGITSQQLKAPFINVLPSFGKNDNQIVSQPLQFYYSQISINPPFIREIDQNSYENLKNNLLYKVTFVGSYKGVTQTEAQAEIQLPGVTQFRNAIL